MPTEIRIRGARQHNLKDVDLDLPHRTLTVVTGPSGSGKSSLALDTLFAEGQRRYVESLSSYAKQFLERMEKPDVERIEGITPAVAIEQKNPTKSSRSTVGTATEVYDYMRLLWARVGRTYCPRCDSEIRPDTVTSVVDALRGLEAGTRFMITYPLVLSDTVRHGLVVENLRALGFVRVLVDGETVDLAAPEADDPDHLGVDLTRADGALVVVDRLVSDTAERERIADSVGTAFLEGDGELVVVLADGRRMAFTERFRCASHPEVEFHAPSPRFFSFNSPYGSCPTCTGFGATLEYDPALIIPNDARSLDEGAVDPWTKPRYDAERDLLRAFAAERGVSMHTSWRNLPEEFREEVLRGEGAFQGVIPFLRSRESKRYKQYIRVFLRQYQTPQNCPACAGARLRPEALHVRVGGRTIAEVADDAMESIAGWVGGIELTPMERQIAETILNELESRLGFLVDVGLGYLTLSRQMRTLSGGEAQRINLAGALGSNLVDTLYVLDEPTIGLHPKDTGALLGILERLRIEGNTVVVVEHEPQAILRADHVVELGPASGEHGGEVVFEGSPEELVRADTETGRYVSGRSRVELPLRSHRVDGPAIELLGATLHNVRDVDCEIPLGALTVVTGVSGSGKSTLVHDVLYRALEQKLGDGETSAKQHLGELVGTFRELRGADRIDDVVLVDQSPIGRTPRSNPVTYIGAWSEVRRIFSEQPLALQRQYGPRHFSFNVEGGRCEACKGAGRIEVEMIFMADVFVPCEHCQGRRFKSDVLEVTYRDHNLADVLEMTVDRAIRFFLKQDRLGKALWQLQQVGLGYLRLGQPAPTLSGGEAQRLKIARELVRARKKGGDAPLPAGRAHDGSFRGGRAPLARRDRSAPGRRPYGGGDRAQSGRHPGGRLDHRPGSGRRGPRRQGGCDGAPRRGRADRRESYRRVPAVRPRGGRRVRMSSRRAPTVSVLLPVRDAQPYLDAALRSIAEQTMGDFEVLAVEDGSTDGSAEALHRWARSDPRVRVLPGGTPGRPLGLVAALERARAGARGRYLARMDADDVTPPDRFARQTALMEEDPATVLCGLPVRYVPREELSDGALAYERWINGLEDPDAIARDLFVECPIAHPTFLLRRDATDAVGGYRSRDWPEDYDLVLRLWEAGGRFRQAPGAPHHWRDHPKRASRTDPRYAIARFQALKSAVLARSRLSGGHPVVWGAGPTGKAFARRLAALDRPVSAFVDLDRRKIGQTIHGAPVLAPSALGPPAGRHALAAVAGAVPRAEIRSALATLGWVETRDFTAVA